jgi:hypothetical protein
MEVSGLFHAPATLTSPKRSQDPLNERLGGLQCQFGSNGEEINIVSLRGSKPHFDPRRDTIFISSPLLPRLPILQPLA